MVKCRICGNKIERNDAYKVVVNDKNEYYCNEKEYRQKQIQKAYKDNTYKIICEIFGYAITNSTLFKELNELSAKNSYEKIFSYICDNKQMLENSIDKYFSTEHTKIKYFLAIIKNNIVGYVIDDEPYITSNEYEILDIKYKAKKKRRAMCDIERELLDG